MSGPSRRQAGVVGLGKLGSALAHCLATKGVGVVACERDAGARAAATAADIEVVESPAAAVGRVRPDPVLVVVRGDDEVTDVLFGKAGVATAGRGSTVAVVTTLHPATMRTLAARASSDGVDVVDSPVSGGSARARDGTLTTMVSGPAPVLEVIDPVMRSFSARVHTVGHEVGQAQAAKLVNQLLMGIGLVGVGEGMRLAADYGLDEETLRPVLADGTASSWVLQHWPRLRAYWEAGGAPELSVGLVAHDLATILDEADERGLELPLARLARSRFDRAWSS